MVTILPSRLHAQHLRRLILLSLVLFLEICFSSAQAATIYASSVAQSDVIYAVSKAVDGDVVQVPAGTAQWTTNFVVKKGITLQGAGVGNTVILDYNPDPNAKGNLIWIAAVPGKNTRLTGFEFRNGNRTSATFGYNGTVALSGVNTDGGTVRVDNCKFNLLASFPVTVNGAVGVIDHCDFILTSIGVYLYHDNWNGVPYGDGSWAAPVDWNGSNWMVIESCNMSFPSTTYAVVDGYRGARWIFRYNNVVNGWLEAHGTESGQRFRGTRAIQVYGNTFTGNNAAGQLVNLRSGTALICSNNASGYVGNVAATLACYRTFFYFKPWGGADGTNQWDRNALTAPADSGTASAATTLKVTDGTKNWAANQWAGYSVQNKTTGNFSLISGNTANTLSFLDSGGFGASLQFSAGDKYEIWRVTEAMDQPGKGRGDLLSGDFPSPRWLNEATEPVYQWGNLINGSRPIISAHAPQIQRGVHYFDEQPLPGFVPLPYPHPLVSASGSTGPILSGPVPPAAPSNLRIVQ